jgi:hypothetical protein
VILLVASTAFGQLQEPAADRLTNYLNWFAPLNPASGQVAPGQESPTPHDIDNTERAWSNWVPNLAPTNLPGPIVGITDGLFCEVVFLGETGDCWGQFGYTNNGTDHLLSGSSADRQFGSFALPLPTERDAFDFFVERTEAGSTERYYAFTHSLNSPGASPGDGYWGTLAPLASVGGASDLPFAVLSFEHQDPRYREAADPALFVFAVRAGAYWNDAPVPEPATYGLGAALALLALIASRRLRST